MSISDWKYYKQAAVSTLAPHETPDTSVIASGEIWSAFPGKKPLLTRYSTDWDCGHESTWWYVIKDTPFDITSLKSKRRYEINKGNKNFSVRIIDPLEFQNELFEITKESYASWPKKYRPSVDKTSFINGLENKGNRSYYGALFSETNELCGYAVTKAEGSWIDFAVLRVMPSYEKYAINAALVNKILELNKEFIENGGYICDGSRSISHETAFQDYLEKYFEFRKAYCSLHIEYNPRIKKWINALYPIRKILKKLDGIGAVHKINGVLSMEELVRMEKTVDG